MLSAQIFNLYQPIDNDDSITKLETRTYLPFVKSFENNDTVEIVINRPDVWLLMYDAAISIHGQMTKTGSGSVKLVNNFGAFLFESIKYEICGFEVDSVKDPGIISTVRGYLTYDKDDNQELATAGWNYPNSPLVDEKGKFNLRIPLRHLLNIFNDYKQAICGKQSLRLVRARNDSNSMQITPSSEGATTGKIKISGIELKVQHVHPNDVLKIQLLQEIKKDRPILIPSRQWEFFELPALTTGSTKEVWNVKTASAIDCPRFIICCFQTNRKHNEKEDVTLFDHIDVSDVRVMLNGDYYPQEQSHLRFNDNDYGEAHVNYTKFHKLYNNDTKAVPLDYADYKNKAIFVIDCSRRDESFKSSMVDVKLDIQSNTGFPSDTRCYCIIIHDNVLEYLPLSEVIRKLM